MDTDYLVVGAGLAGLVLAERLATQRGKRCVVVDRRNHIGGNCYDEYDRHGVLIHKYGPHYFRTNSQRVRRYLSAFTDWHEVTYRVLSYREGRYWSFPINLKTFEQLTKRPSTEAEFARYLAANRVHIDQPRNSEDLIVSQVGWELYRKFFEGYTLKQWKRHPRELDISVCGRIPIRTAADDRYFNEEFQALPQEGYTAMFQRIVHAAGDHLSIHLETAYSDVRNTVRWKHLVYTGSIDEYYNFVYGPLAYRSLRFEPEYFTPQQLQERLLISGRAGFWQPALQVNYPSDQAYTRIVEVKHATGQKCSGTTIVREYPTDFGPGTEPYYPVPAPSTRATYLKYAALAAAETNVCFVGRLATYRYCNMDEVVDMALDLYERLQ